MPILTLFFIIFIVLSVAFLIVFFNYFLFWLQAFSSGVRLSVFQMIGMRLRGLNPIVVGSHLIMLTKAGLSIESEELEAHALSGGNLKAVSDAAIAANKAGLNYQFSRLAAIDLAGRDVIDGVQTTVEPKVLVCPKDKSTMIKGVTGDGIRLGVKVRITVRTNFEKLIGGANEETVIARVGEGIIAAIGNAESHKHILEKPELISRYILDHALDRGTSFEIVSVDVADIEVIDNIGARLRDAQAVADKQVAQAKAEMRRVQAVAKEKEMRAKVVEMTSQLVFVRSELPKAVAISYYEGNIWKNQNPVKNGFNRRLWDFFE